MTDEKCVLWSTTTKITQFETQIERAPKFEGEISGTQNKRRIPGDRLHIVNIVLYMIKEQKPQQTNTIQTRNREKNIQIIKKKKQITETNKYKKTETTK